MSKDLRSHMHITRDMIVWLVDNASVVGRFKTPKELFKAFRDKFKDKYFVSDCNASLYGVLDSFKIRDINPSLYSHNLPSQLEIDGNPCSIIQDKTFNNFYYVLVKVSAEDSQHKLWRRYLNCAWDKYYPDNHIFSHAERIIPLDGNITNTDKDNLVKLKIRDARALWNDIYAKNKEKIDKLNDNYSKGIADGVVRKEYKHNYQLHIHRRNNITLDNIQDFYSSDLSIKAMEWLRENASVVGRFSSVSKLINAFMKEFPDEEAVKACANNEKNTLALHSYIYSHLKRWKIKSINPKIYIYNGTPRRRVYYTQEEKELNRIKAIHRREAHARALAENKWQSHKIGDVCMMYDKSINQKIPFIKIKDSPSKWKRYSCYLWNKAHPDDVVGKGCSIFFMDGNPANVSLDNMRLVYYRSSFITRHPELFDKNTPREVKETLLTIQDIYILRTKMIKRILGKKKLAKKDFWQKNNANIK